MSITFTATWPCQLPLQKGSKIDEKLRNIEEYMLAQKTTFVIDITTLTPNPNTFLPKRF